MATPEKVRRLTNSARHIAPGAKRVGPSDPNEAMSVTVAVRRRSGAPDLPDQEHWAANPPGSRRYVSSDEFARQWGADPADLDLVAAFAGRHGLAVAERNIEQRIVIVSGKVSQISEAFGVELGRYEVEQRAGDEDRGRPRAPRRGRGRDRGEREIYRG
jgi:kumamolisin